MEYHDLVLPDSERHGLAPRRVTSTGRRTRPREDHLRLPRRCSDEPHRKLSYPCRTPPALPHTLPHHYL